MEPSADIVVSLPIERAEYRALSARAPELRGEPLYLRLQRSERESKCDWLAVWPPEVIEP